MFNAPKTPPIFIKRKISRAGKPIKRAKMSSFVWYKIILLMYIYQIMSNNFGYIDIILLGMIAGFIILRLRNILGRRTGHESKIYPEFAERKFNIPKRKSEF